MQTDNINWIKINHILINDLLIIPKSSTDNMIWISILPGNSDLHNEFDFNMNY